MNIGFPTCPPFRPGSEDIVFTGTPLSKFRIAQAWASESGGRAPGNRSVIADTRVRSARDYINPRSQRREYFRSVAPAVLAGARKEWFPETHADSPYMRYAVPREPAKAAQIREALHLDGTARVQTVHRGLHGRFYEFLQAWAQHSGIPVLH